MFVRLLLIELFSQSLINILKQQIGQKEIIRIVTKYLESKTNENTSNYMNAAGIKGKFIATNSYIDEGSKTIISIYTLGNLTTKQDEANNSH